MPTTSITSFSVHLRVLRRHDVPTTSRKPSPTVQLWQDCWCPNSPKTQTPEIPSLSGEDKEQKGTPIKAQRIQRKEDEKKYIVGKGTQRKENKRGRERTKRGRKTKKNKQRGRNRRQKENPSNEHPHHYSRKTPATEFEGRITFSVFICVVIAACGGLMFGYDIGVSGGVTAMDDFLKKFFYQVWERRQEAHENNYCKYDNKKLQLFTSSLYIAALIASFLASKMCSKFGRKPTMQLASLFFIGGVALTTFAVNIEMLIIGRLLLGCGVGFANQAVPLFLSELAPAKIRGALNISFQLFITIGILVANIVNYVVGKIHPYGFRISLGIAGVPALLLCFGSLAIYETPTSLIERKKVEQGRAVLKKIRGVDNVDLEYDSIVHACEVASQITQPYHELMKRESRPPLVIAIMMQVFQQFTGINAIMFYAPVLFQTVGFGSDAALLSSVVTGLVNVLSTTVSVVLVDKVGRRALLLEACVQMLITQCIIGGVLMKDLKTTGTLPNGDALVVVIMVCVFVAGFAWSWGPLGWLIPSETFPLETRTAGFSFAVSSNMLFTFVIAQAFLSTLCHLKAGIFFFFAAWIVVMGLFALFLLPETKGVPVDEMVDRVWKQHWFWKRFFNDEQVVEKKAIEMIHPHVT